MVIDCFKLNLFCYVTVWVWGLFFGVGGVWFVCVFCFTCLGFVFVFCCGCWLGFG